MGWRLKMQAAQRAAAIVERDAPLWVIRAQSTLKKGIAAEQTRKKPSFIFHFFKLYEKKPGYVQRPKQHCGLTPLQCSE
jgi:hypothetical protein